MRVRLGFTLIELLVVVAIIALLLAILLPVAARVRESGREARCRSNQHQMMFGWGSYLAHHKNQIPHVRDSHLQPNWGGAMDWAMAYRGVAWNSASDAGVACPAVQHAYSRMYYSGAWGYTVNALWIDQPREWNSLKPWDFVKNMSQYPWFVDGQVYATGAGVDHTIYPYVPCQLPRFSRPSWGLGFHHAGGRRAIVTFADGSARGVALAEMAEAAKGEDDLTWFENR